MTKCLRAEQNLESLSIMPKIIIFIESDSLEFTMREYQSRNSFQNKVAYAHLIQWWWWWSLSLSLLLLLLLLLIRFQTPMWWAGTVFSRIALWDCLLRTNSDPVSCRTSRAHPPSREKCQKLPQLSNVPTRAVDMSFFFSFFFFSSVHKRTRLSDWGFFLIFPLFIKSSRGFVM